MILWIKNIQKLSGVKLSKLLEDPGWVLLASSQLHLAVKFMGEGEEGGQF